MAEFTISERGKRKLLYNGYAYVCEKSHDTVVYWQCEKKRFCKARAILSVNCQAGGHVTTWSEHTHTPDPTRLHVLKAVEIARTQATDTRECMG
uniref:FLYWCH-type domain-containing protein n=1 Tax=Romanomermis culicivorax TaxID=13658 RepID=A0A915I576_ROMCU